MNAGAKRTAVICLCLFALALVVRLVVWQNNKTAIAGVQYVVTHVYKQDARLLVAGDVRGFVAGPDPPSDATIIMHPPGYPIFIAAIYSLFGENELLRILQIMLNSLASVLIFLLASKLFDERVAIIAGVLTAMSPQFAYHSAIILPDELSALPVLAALYFFARACDERKLAHAIAGGILLGFSCWLRANGVLLPVFFAAAAIVLFPKGWRIRPVAALLAAFILTIAPLATRNYTVFGAAAPVSIGFGTTFVEGLGDLDTDGRSGMPTTDEGVMSMDAEHFGRQDYYGSLYTPDGVERERGRVLTGLNVVKKYPGWFAAGVLQRGLMAFRMERVPVIEPNSDERATTPAWLYLVNVPLKLFQRLFITAIILPLVIFGVVFLLTTSDGRRRLLTLAVVPLYFFIVQPIVHTEYRYLLPATHVLIIIASLPLGSLVGLLWRSKGDRLAAAE